MCHAGHTTLADSTMSTLEAATWRGDQEMIESSEENCCFHFERQFDSRDSIRSLPEVLAPEQEWEYDNMLQEQELRSTPSKQYVQQLHSSAATQAAAVRSSTIDWMVDTAQKLKLSSDSLFLAVQLLDRFLAAVLQECAGTTAAQACLQANKLQLSAITALWVAAKYEGACVPGASAFLQHLSGAAHGNQHGLLPQLLEAEQVLLTTIDHRLAAPTAKTFLRRYLARVAVSRPVYFAAGYVAELSLLDSGMLCFLPSVVAASAYVWGLMLMGSNCSNTHLTKLSGYSMWQVLPCILRVARVHAAACNTQLPCAISCKYLDGQLEQVAALPPVEQHKVAQLQQGQALLQQRQEQQQQQQRHTSGAMTAYSFDC